MKQHLPRLFALVSPWLPEISATAAQFLFIHTSKYPRPQKEKIVWDQGKPHRFPSGRAAQIFGPSNRPWAVFVAGWEGRSSQFYSWVSPFLKAGYRVMLWDGPAHGENPEARTHMVEFGLALRDDLESLKTGVEVLVAHSFGGGASAWAVSKGLQVANLFVIGTPVSIEGVLHRFEKRLRLHPKASHAFRKQMEHLTGLTVNKISLTHYYPTLSMKTRVTQIHDRLDKEVPYAEIAEFQKKYPDANIFETEGLGHRRILLSDKVISEVLRRLSKKVL